MMASGRAFRFLAVAAGAALLPPAAAGAAGRSVFVTPPPEPRAVTVRGVGDGRADDTAAIQTAIDAAAASGGKGNAGGIVFLPTGRYRIARTIYVWPGVRVFGVGATRPTLVLGDRTPGFARGLATMVIFAGARRGPAVLNPDWNQAGTRVPFPPPGSVPSDPAIADANPGTFYSAMSNVDVAIGRGNPAATAIRFHAAQHAYLSHMDFELGSALAGIYQVGNEAEDLHFHGGRYGILTEKPSPAWQFTLIDSSFDGQRGAAIREHEAGLTLVNVAFRNVPVAIDIDRGYGDWLWGKDVRLENVSRAAVVISNEGNAYTQVGFENALAANTPVFARFRDSGRTVAEAGRTYHVAAFGYGLAVPEPGRTGAFATTMKAEPVSALPAPTTPAIPALPPTDQWADVRALGAKGDDASDDTAAIQRAVDGHRVVYFPAGHYRVADTIRLRPDSVLVGLHPGLTQIVLPDDTPAFRGIGPARALIETAAGGAPIVSGLGLDTGGVNPRATALLWHAGAASLVDDVKFQGGHGTDRADGRRMDPYNANHSADPDPARRWDGQYPSLWVQSGGGTFANVWSPSTFAQAGMLVSATEVPGHVYQLSAEHHVRTEIVLDHARHWELLAPQTEEEAGESGDAASLEIRDSRDILVANYHAYRVTRSLRPAPSAVRLYGANEVRFRNVHVNAESGLATCDEGGCATYLRASKYPFANAIEAAGGGGEVREREFATLDVTPGQQPVPTPVDARVRKLADGFFSLGGGAAGPDGGLYFVDHVRQRIYGWSAAAGLSLVSDAPLDPVNLAVDDSGNLLVLSSAGREGTVYSLDPRRLGAAPQVVPATPATGYAGAAIVLPVNWWNNGEFRDQLDPATLTYPTLAELFARTVAQPIEREYRSPDGSLALPAYRVFQQGPSDFRGWRFSDTLDASGLVAARSGARVFVSNESEDRTYSAVVGVRGALTALKPFADRGGESVAVGADGRVFVANGQVFVYGPDGTERGRIDVPERPLQLVFGGEGGRTLFILTAHALYAAEP